MPASPSTARAINDRLALRLLQQEGPLTAGQLKQLTGLSRPTRRRPRGAAHRLRTDHRGRGGGGAAPRAQRAGCTASSPTARISPRSTSAPRVSPWSSPTCWAGCWPRRPCRSRGHGDRTCGRAGGRAGRTRGEGGRGRTPAHRRHRRARPDRPGHRRTPRLRRPARVAPATWSPALQERLPEAACQRRERDQPRRPRGTARRRGPATGTPSSCCGSATAPARPWSWTAHYAAVPPAAPGRSASCRYRGRIALPSATDCEGGFHSLAGSAAIVELAREHGVTVEGTAHEPAAARVVRAAVARVVRAAGEAGAAPTRAGIAVPEAGSAARFLDALADRLAVGVASVVAILDPDASCWAARSAGSAGTELAGRVAERVRRMSPLPTEVEGERPRWGCRTSRGTAHRTGRGSGRPVRSSRAVTRARGGRVHVLERWLSGSTDDAYGRAVPGRPCGAAHAEPVASAIRAARPGTART